MAGDCGRRWYFPRRSDAHFDSELSAQLASARILGYLGNRLEPVHGQSRAVQAVVGWSSNCCAGLWRRNSGVPADLVFLFLVESVTVGWPLTRPRATFFRSATAVCRRPGDQALQT